MRRILLFISILLLIVPSLKLGPSAKAQSETPNTANQSETDRSAGQPARLIKTGLKKLAAKKLKPVTPKVHKLTKPIQLAPKSREALIKARRAERITPQTISLLPPIPKGTKGSEVVISSDFQAQSSSGGAIVALRDANGDGIADQETIVANNAVLSGDAITKIVASQLFFGRYFAITENSELIQIDDVDGDYIADSVIAFDDVTSSTGLGIGITTAILDDGTEAVYLLTTETGFDGLFYTADDSVSIAGFFNSAGSQGGAIDSVSEFFSTRQGFSSLGGLTAGVETSLIFNLAEFDNSGRVISGALYSYYDFDGDGIPDDFANNQNDGIFADTTNGDVRPAIATDIIQVGTDYYVSAPLVALGLATNDDIAVYSDFNATQVADSSAAIFAPLSGLSGFSSDLGGLAISSDGKRVATARNQTFKDSVQSSQLLLMSDDNFNQRADQTATELFDNSSSGLAGVCFGNSDLLGPRPLIVFPRLKPAGKLALDAIGARIAPGALLIVDNREQFTMKFNSAGLKWIVTATTSSSPGGLTIRQVLSSGDHLLTIKNPSGEQSLPVTINVR